MSDVHEMAKVGFGTGTNELYDRARPKYPPPALGFIRSKLPENGPFNIVEIGAGTGLFTRSLLAHPQWQDSVGQYHAVEPSEGMRNTFKEKVADERVTVSEGTFVQTNEESGSADAVIIAQAFHWAHPNYDGAMKEIGRILKPQGVAVFIWNMEDRDAAKWVGAVRDLYEEYENDTPQFRLNKWEATFQTPSYISSFHPPERFYTEWILPADTLSVQERTLSKSYVSALPDDKKGEVRRGIVKILETHEKSWLDEPNGKFAYPYKTTVIAMKKLD